MSYEDIDGILSNWAEVQEICLLREDVRPNRRYFYTSSELGETFQFVIEPVNSGSVRIDAHLIESPTNQEGHFFWEVPTSQFLHGLDLSLGSAQAWFKRLAR